MASEPSVGERVVASWLRQWASTKDARCCPACLDELVEPLEPAEEDPGLDLLARRIDEAVADAVDMGASDGE